jgi:hypothetical protein
LEIAVFRAPTHAGKTSGLSSQLRHLFFLAASFRCAARGDGQEFRAILGGDHLAAAVARPLAFATGKRIAVDGRSDDRN